MKRGKMKQRYVGSGCGSVGRAVASDSEVHGSNGVIGNIYSDHPRSRAVAVASSWVLCCVVIPTYSKA